MGYSPWGHKELDTTEATEYTCTESAPQRRIKVLGEEKQILGKQEPQMLLSTAAWV